MKIMNEIEYGFKDLNDNLAKNEKSWEHFGEFYYLFSPEELLNKKCRVC